MPLDDTRCSTAGLHFTVEASTDGGDTWTTLWDASKDLENGSGYYQTGTCELTVPEEFRDRQCTACLPLFQEGPVTQPTLWQWTM